MKTPRGAPPQLPPLPPILNGRPTSLRDWYAGIVAAACEPMTQDEDGRYWHPPQDIALRSFAISDAMLRERTLHPFAPGKMAAANTPDASLRDWYAGCAMVTAHCMAQDTLGKFWHTEQEIALRVLAVSDALLRERQK